MDEGLKLIQQFERKKDAFVSVWRFHVDSNFTKLDKLAHLPSSLLLSTPSGD